MRSGSPLFICLALFGLVFSTAARADYPIEVIELKYVLLDEVLPVLRPLAGDDGMVSGMGSQVIIKAAPQRVRDIRKVLARVDRPPRQLLITVSTPGDSVYSSTGYAASAGIKAGDVRAGINSPGRPLNSSRARISAHSTDSRRVRTARQRVQVLEGRPAYINSGTQIPVVDGYRNSAPLHNVTRGFYVVPRLNGESVMLEIMQHDDRPGQVRGTYDIQRAGTLVRGRLGEWVDLGGIDSRSHNQRRGLARSINSQGVNTQQIRVKVECLDCNAN